MNKILLNTFLILASQSLLPYAPEEYSVSESKDRKKHRLIHKVQLERLLCVCIQREKLLHLNSPHQQL